MAIEPELGGVLSARVALLTGATGGIGRALAERLGMAGVKLAIAYQADSSAEALASAMAQRGCPALAFRADMADPAGPQGLVQEVEVALGPIEVLICNAAIGPRQSLEEVTAGDFDAVMAVNLRAPFLLAQAVLPGMRRRGFGRVLFISSVAAFTGGSVGPHYAASKAGLLGLTHHLAPRQASFGVTVNALAPGLISPTGMVPREDAELASRVPLGRLGRPSEVADLALAMLANGYLTDKVITLDGGIHPR